MLDSELNYETYLKKAKFMLLGDAEAKEPDQDVLNRAQYAHALTLMDHLRDAYLNVIECSYKLKTENGTTYMLFGAGRRYSMVLEAYRTIIFTAPVERTEPLTNDETKTLTQDLNTVYINLSGTLDNLAWVLLYEKAPEVVNMIHKGDINLFGRKMRNNVPDTLASILEELSVHASWAREVKARRDPVAHRIPLIVLPPFVNPEEGKKYQATYNRAIDAADKSDFENSGQHFKALDRIGTFVPAFEHHPEDGLTPMYPTIPTDMAHLVQITRVVLGRVC